MDSVALEYDLEKLCLNFEGMSKSSTDNLIGSAACVSAIGQSLNKLKKIKQMHLNCNE